MVAAREEEKALRLLKKGGVTLVSPATGASTIELGGDLRYERES
jgi:hypothetical protein